MEPSVALQIQLIGRFTVLLPGGHRAGPWARPSARRLVQLLALRPDHAIGREELALHLFVNLAPGRAANAVAKALSMARAAFGPDASRLLAADRARIWIEPAARVTTDLAALTQRLHAALALEPGPDREPALLAALESDAQLLPEEPYADWALAARDELDDLRQAARLARARELTGDLAGATGRSDLRAVIAAWRAVAAHEPTSEEAAIGLMHAYAASGRRDRAIRVYLRCRTALADELGVEASTALEDARASLVPTRPAGRVAPVVPADFPDSERTFGRDRLLRRLRRALGATPSGAGPALLITGPAGIGKSHVARAVAMELAGAGWQVLMATCLPEDRQIPFAALREALAPVAAEHAGRLSPAIDAIFAEGRASNGATAVEVADGGAMRIQLARELGTLLDSVAGDQPLLLLLDDLQRADPALQNLLHRLALRRGRRRWAILGTARSDEPDAPPPLLGAPGGQITLPPLTATATRSVVRAMLSTEGGRLSAAEVRSAVDRSAGNPFFATELARAAAEEVRSANRGAVATGQEGTATELPSPVPEAIVALLGHRLEMLSPAARAILALVALAGNEASYELLLGAAARLSGVETATGVAALDELIGSGLAVEVGDRLALSHPLLRDATISLTNAVRRAAAHSALAAELEAQEAGGHDPDRTRRSAIAAHRLAAFGSARLPSMARAAARAGFGAGQEARRIYADEVAMGLLEAALDAWSVLPRRDRTELAGMAVAAWLTIGHIHLDRDDSDRAEAAYRRALELAIDDADLARAWSAMAGVPYRSGRLAEALEVYRAGLGALEHGDPMARARLESDAAWCLLRLDRIGEALPVLERIAPLLSGAPEVHVRCRLRDRLGSALAASGRIDEALASFDAGVLDATEHGNEHELLVLSMHRAPIRAGAGRLNEALDDVGLAARLIDKTNDRYMRSVVHWVSAEVREMRGELAEALEERDREIRILVTLDNARHLAIAQTHRASLLAQLGRDRDAELARAAAAVAVERAGDPRLAAQMGLDRPPPGDGKSSGRASS